MRVIVEQLVEWRLWGETEVLRENLPQRHFVHHKSHMTRTPGRRGGKPATNRLSYGAAKLGLLSRYFHKVTEVNQEKFNRFLAEIRTGHPLPPNTSQKVYRPRKHAGILSL
jgi:hypothetical protein